MKRLLALFIVLVCINGTTFSQNGSGKTYDETTKIYTLMITNTPGYALPSTGGAGTRALTAVGAVLTVSAILGLAWKTGRRTA